MKEIKLFKKDSEVSKASKHSIRNNKNQLKRNTFIYFQLGLVMCLLLAYALLEMNFEYKATDLTGYSAAIPEETVQYVVPDFKIYKEPINQPKEKTVKKKVLTSEPKVVPNDSADEIDLKTVITEPEPTNQVNITDIKVEGPPEDVDEFFNMNGVEVVPIYPGCEKLQTNEARKTCMSEKLMRLIQKKFNTNVASEEGLQGIQRIQVQFKINANGQVTDVLARAPNSVLEKEAIRVINHIPEMTPGKQRDKNVSVMYTMPIIFKVQN